MSREKKTVLVVGGGFAGREAYRKLKKSFNVTMVDSRGFFEYTPSILRCLVEPSHASKIIVPHHASVAFTTGEVIEIKSEDSAEGAKKATSALLADGSTLAFDYAVITAGSDYARPVKGPAKQTMAERIASLEEDAAKLATAKSVLVVGGGFTGVELAAEIAGHYNEKPSDASKTIFLVSATERLLPDYLPEVSEYVRAWLEARGVEVITGDRVPGVSAQTPAYFGPVKTVMTQSGRDLAVEAIFGCVGYSANGGAMGSPGRPVSCAATTLAEGYSNVFCAGDCLKHASMGSVLAAIGSAGIAARNVIALDKGSTKFATFPMDVCGDLERMPMMGVCSLYKHDGVMQAKGMVKKGKLPATIKVQNEDTMLSQQAEGAMAIAMFSMQKNIMYFVLRNFIKNAKTEAPVAHAPVAPTTVPATAS